MQQTKKVKSKNVAKKPPSDGFKKLKILISVVPRNKTEFYMDFISEYEVNFQASVLAQGTAKSDTLYMLGLEDSDKSVIFSVLREDRAQEAMHALEDKFDSLKNGKAS